MNSNFVFSSDKNTIDILKQKLVLLHEDEDGCYFQNDNSADFEDKDLVFIFTNDICI